MKIVIPGGSGQVGTILARDFHRDGHDVVVLSRTARPADWRVMAWDGSSLGLWARELDGADVVINLAGRSVNCRYTPANRRAIFDSRVISTQVVGEAIAQAARPPRVWLQASTATIYAHRYDTANDEATGVMGGTEADVPASWSFSIEVARAWERACAEASGRLPRTRTVALRSSVILSPDRGGIFDTLLGLVRRGLGGAAGDGRQFVSWIHGHDFIRAVHWLIDRTDMDGIVNVCSPNPLPNAAFMRALRDAWGTRLGLPASRWMIHAGAVLLRTEAELVLKSRRVVPGRLVAHGFQFQHVEWPAAAVDLCARWRQARGPRQAVHLTRQ